jgi:methylmalonyl-CoA mutase C-terminal domain/subunit
MDRKIRVLVAKPGLDGHDLGARMICKVLRDAGTEVIYTGLRQSVEAIVEAAIQEDVDVVGLSILSGAHLSLTRKVVQRLKEKGTEDIIVVVGGLILKEDVDKLKEVGAQAVFPSGTPTQVIVDYFKGIEAGTSTPAGEAKR